MTPAGLVGGLLADSLGFMFAVALGLLGFALLREISR